MPEKKILTADQQQLVKEIIEAHGLDADQISFENDDLKPIFDYEAVMALSLKLTDIKDIDVSVYERGNAFITARCTVELEDGRTRRVEEIAYINEAFPNGEKIETLRLAEQVAKARASRLGIRSVGVNLFNAHKKYMETGEIASGHTNHDPRYSHYQENKTIVSILGWSDETYRNFISDNFEGKTSQKDLNDLELQRFKTMLRSFDRAEKAKQIAAEPQAA